MFQRHNIRPSFYYCMKKEMGHDNFDYIAIENKRNKKSFIFISGEHNFTLCFIKFYRKLFNYLKLT